MSTRWASKILKIQKNDLPKTAKLANKVILIPSDKPQSETVKRTLRVLRKRRTPAIVLKRDWLDLNLNLYEGLNIIEEIPFSKSMEDVEAMQEYIGRKYPEVNSSLVAGNWIH